MNKKGFTLLSKQELLEDYYLTRKNSIKNAIVTDYAVLLGTCTNSSKKGCRGYWWLKDFSKNSNTASCIDYNGKIIDANLYSTACGIRPAINYSLIKPFCDYEYEAEKFMVVNFGEYPNSVVIDLIADELERRYLNNTLIEKGDSFTYLEFDGSKYSIKKTLVYECHDKKFVRVIPNAGAHGCLQDGTKITHGKAYWLRVTPIKWIVDKENDIAISSSIIMGGIPFIGRENIEDFEDSFINIYLDKCFAKEIISSDNSFRNSFLESLEDDKKKVYAYDLDLGRVTEEDIIKGAIESDVSVFLHGRSSDGKSARVKELDPECEIIYMRNATPDSLNGKSVYDASIGKMIDVPPTWYKKLVDKCNKESDKIHIIFFDELTNALPSMQGMAFNIILDHEVNGKWKLPKNARIVAAGNDLGDSLAANKMAEPLFNRFAHVYINTGVEDWLKWAVEDKDDYQKLDYEEVECEDKIHPMIISYIEDRYNDGVNVLRTPYDGVKPNADPRKWEMASKLLYKTKKLKMLRALVGETITNDFTEFVSSKTDDENIVESTVKSLNKSIPEIVDYWRKFG